MANTKKTPVTAKYRCPLCGEKFLEENHWSRHLLTCGKRRMERETYVCDEQDCNYASAKKSDLTRHKKRRHDAIDTSESEWERQDPGNLTDLTNSGSTPGNKAPPNTPDSSFVESQIGCTIRKPTNPLPVAAPQKKKLPPTFALGRPLGSSSPRTTIEPTSISSTILEMASVTTPVSCKQSSVVVTSPMITSAGLSLIEPLYSAPIITTQCTVSSSVMASAESCAISSVAETPSAGTSCSLFGSSHNSRHYSRVTHDVQTQTARRHRLRRRTVTTTEDNKVTEELSEEEWWE